MPKTVILSAARTPIGKLGGGLASLDATELGGAAIRCALERADVAPEEVQHVIMGQVLQAGQGQIPSRQAQIKAGIPKEVSSETINKVCASGIRAAGLLDAAIRAGDLEVAVGGGMESMSNAPYLLKQARFGFRMGDGKAIDSMINDGLTNPFSGKHMAQEASEVASELELTRPDMDRWSLRSHQLAIKATDEGRLPEEIVPVTVKGKKGDTVVEICRKHGISQQSFYLWKKKYAGLGLQELRELRQLRDENAKLKRLVADLSLDRHILQEIVAKQL